MGARLALYSDNKTYAEIAAQSWEWTQGVGLVDKDWNVYDGANTGPDPETGKERNCTNINKLQYSYNAAIMIQGAAVMYKYVSNSFLLLPLPLPQQSHQPRLSGLYFLWYAIM